MLRRRFEALDGARGLAALLVLAYHIELYGFHSQLLRHGYLAVDLFFMLSGFVIGAAYEDRLNGSLTAWRFIFEVRAIRLYPLLILGMLFAELNIALHVTSQPHAVRVFFQQALFVPALRSGKSLYPLNNMQWSLLFELVANVVHVIFLRRQKVAVLIPIAVCSALLLLVAALVYQTLDRGNALAHAWVGLARVGFSYTTGLIIYRLLRSNRLPPLIGDWRLLASLMLGAILAPLRFGTIAGALQDWLCVVVVFPVVVGAAAQIQLDVRVAATALFLGELSYPIYALQGPFLAQAAFWSKHAEPSLAELVWIATFPIAIAVSWAAYKLFDEPVREWLRRRAGVLFRPPAQTAP